MASQLNDLITSNEIENVSQSAYKHGHSTKTALLSIKMKFILFLVEMTLLLLFSSTNQQQSMSLIIVHSLNVCVPGLVLEV